MARLDLKKLVCVLGAAVMLAGCGSMAGQGKSEPTPAPTPFIAVTKDEADEMLAADVKAAQEILDAQKKHMDDFAALNGNVPEDWDFYNKDRVDAANKLNETGSKIRSSFTDGDTTGYMGTLDSSSGTFLFLAETAMFNYFDNPTAENYKIVIEKFESVEEDIAEISEYLK